MTRKTQAWFRHCGCCTSDASASPAPGTAHLRVTRHLCSRTTRMRQTRSEFIMLVRGATDGNEAQLTSLNLETLPSAGRAQDTSHQRLQGSRPLLPSAAAPSSTPCLCQAPLIASAKRCQARPKTPRLQSAPCIYQAPLIAFAKLCQAQLRKRIYSH